MLRYVLACCLTVAPGAWTAPCFAGDPPPLTVAVMDPLALPLSCPCVKGHAQRRYDKLGLFLESRLQRPVKVLFADDLSKILRNPSAEVLHLIIGKQSVVQFDAMINNLTVRPAMMLAGKDGETIPQGNRKTSRGIRFFLVRPNVTKNIGPLPRRCGRRASSCPPNSRPAPVAATPSSRCWRIPGGPWRR